MKLSIHFFRNLIVALSVIVETPCFAQWFATDVSDFKINSIWFTDSLRGFAIDIQTLYKTTDGGSNWEIDSVLPQLPLQNIFFVSKDTGFITAHSTLLKTIDGGDSWDQIPVDCGFNDVDFINAYDGFGVGECGSFYKTFDGGLNWQMIPGVLVPIESAVSIQFFGPDTGYVSGSYNSNSNTTVMRTFDGGSTFVDLGFTYNWFGVATKNVFFVNPSTGYGNQGPLNKISDYGSNSNWAVLPSTLGFNYYTLTMVNDSVGFDCGAGNGSSSAIVRTTDRWNSVDTTDVPFDLGNVISISCLDEEHCWAGTFHGYILRTNNGGGVLGMQELSNSIEYSFSPNPTSNFISFSSNELFQSIVIKTIWGVIIYHQISLNRKQMQIDVSDFPADVYFIEVECNGKRGIKKFVKQ